MSAILNLTETKAKFYEVVERVSHGEEIIVTRKGHPVARITRHESVTPDRRLGFFKGRIRIAEHFDEWPDDVARVFGVTDQDVTK
jgi:prevent-host-death family protein